MSDQRQHNKPTLEEVLRLKRAERPGPDFWVGFERELRQKQLTALVEKRRWWHVLPLVSTRRIYLPVGATAVVAFALVAVRFNSPARVAGIENTAPRIEASDSDVEVLPATVVASQQARYEEPAVERAEALMTERPVAAPVAVAREDNSPSARSIAANFEHLEQAEPELVQAVMGNRLSSSARVQPALASLDPEPAEVSSSAPRYRLIARYAERVLSPKPEAPDLVRQHLARRLGDDLGDDMSRIGLGGNRVSLKF